jgi:hypothetical protein
MVGFFLQVLSKVPRKDRLLVLAWAAFEYLTADER